MIATLAENKKSFKFFDFLYAGYHHISINEFINYNKKNSLILHIICHQFHQVEMGSKHSLKLFIHENVPTNNHEIQNEYSWNLQKNLIVNVIK